MKPTVRERAEDIRRITGQTSLSRADVMMYLNIKSPTTASLFLSDVPCMGNGKARRWDLFGFAEKYERKLGGAK